MEILYSTFILIYFEYICAIWMPEVNFSPNFDQFQIYKSAQLKNIVYSSVDKDMPINFQWQSVASVSLSFNKISYIIYGGNQYTIAGSKSAFSKSTSAVVICQLSFNDENSNLGKVKCTNVKTNEINFYLGVTVEAVSVSDKAAVIVYCDPLWHVANNSEPKPSGKCYLNFINNGKFERNISIEFCRFSSTSFLSCLAGFSVDLISTNRQLSELQMIVGMPFLHPYGRVKIVDDPFESRTITDPRNGIGKYFNFGYSVSATTTSATYASSPLSDHYGPNVTDIRHDVILTSPDNIIFSSFGLSLKTLIIGGGHSHAVLIGAPFHPLKSMQNVGKVYIFCVRNDNSRSWLSAQLHGEQKDEFFGYVLANIGDINADGNDDLAISSPFLRHDDGRGFVSIYTVSTTCEVNLKPQQILRNTHSQKVGIFGLSIAGRSDLDFNNWPDIVILNSRSNSIELYASRAKFRAECKFSLVNKYDNEQLRKNENIKIRNYVSLIDRIKGNSINLNFLKQYNLIFQIDSNLNTSEKRFHLSNTTITHSISSNLVTVAFSITSLMDIKDMNLSVPIMIAFRLVENCSLQDCDNLKFPLIDWEDCKVHVPARKYICNDSPICDADLSLELVDLQGSDVIYGYDRKFSRRLTLKIFNAGPTVGKDINFKIFVFQNLRIHKVESVNIAAFKTNINQNQTEAICEFDQEEIDVNTEPIIVRIELYFVNFKDASQMNFRHNYIVVELFSEVKDSNITNNRMRIDYTFLYAPNVTFSGSPSKETVVDPRNGSLLIRHGKRMAIDKIGPMLTHQYIIENSGNASISNMTVTVNIPMLTEDGYRILYVFDNIRGINRSKSFWMSIAPQIYVGAKHYPCKLPDGYVNPLKIIGFETHELHMKNIDIRQISDWTEKVKRRSISDPVKADSSDSSDNIKAAKGKMYRVPIETIHCDRKSVYLKSLLCAKIQCKVPVLPPHNQARLQINAWLWAHTFFKKQISDIMVYTTLQVDFTEIPRGVHLKWDKTKSYSQSQHFIFQNFKSKIRHFRPWWPIILGIVVGILILSILIVALYKCGFFRRNKAKEHIKSKKTKKSSHYPVIIHQDELHTSSSEGNERRMASHSPLIK